MNKYIKTKCLSLSTGHLLPNGEMSPFLTKILVYWCLSSRIFLVIWPSFPGFKIASQFLMFYTKIRAN
jgi:hypothetical protein